MIHRRKFLLKGSTFAASAPAIVRASSLLPALAATDGWTQGGGDIYPTGPSLRLKPGREFAVNSWVHTRLAPDAPLDPNSAAIVANFNRILRETATVTAMENGGAPIYIASPNQPTCRIKVTGTTEKDLWLQTKMNDVPIPDPDTFKRQECPGGVVCDHEAVIYQPSTGRYYEFIGMDATGGTTVDSAGRTVKEWQTVWGGRMGGPGDVNVLPSNPGWWEREETFSQGALATAIPILGLWITVGDILQNAINHPIQILIPQPMATVGVWSQPPAQRTDGLSGLDYSVAEGTVFRLPANINLDDYPYLRPYADGRKNNWRLAAEAIRDYGLCISDTGGFCSIFAENPHTPQYPVDPYIAFERDGWWFPWLDLNYFPWDRLQTLPQHLVSG
jgi:hypothetical protein